ncbi:MAG: class I SAM-dependent methyltransferase [Roseovarius sp.]
MNTLYDDLYSLGCANNVFSTALPDGSFIPTYLARADTRATEFLTQFNRVRGDTEWTDCTFLDLASSEGSTTLGLGQMGSSVHGVEGREAAVHRANVIRDLVGFQNVTYDIGNVMDPSHYIPAHGIFAAGILYHLEDPIGFLELCARHASDFIYIDSHRMPNDDQDISKTLFPNSLSDKHVIHAHGMSIRGIKFKEANSRDEQEGEILRRPRTGIGNTYSVWLSLDDMIGLMARLGFPYHQRIDDHSQFLRSRTVFFRNEPKDVAPAPSFTQHLPKRKPALEAMQIAQARDVEYIKRKGLPVTLIGVEAVNKKVRAKLEAENIRIEKEVVLPGVDGKSADLGQLIELMEGASGFAVLASLNPHMIYQQLILFPKIDYIATSFGMVIKEQG